jgi:hypothetical protein
MTTRLLRIGLVAAFFALLLCGIYICHQIWWRSVLVSDRSVMSSLLSAVVERLADTSQQKRLQADDGWFLLDSEDCDRLVDKASLDNSGRTMYPYTVAFRSVQSGDGTMDYQVVVLSPGRDAIYGTKDDNVVSYPKTLTNISTLIDFMRRNREPGEQGGEPGSALKIVK